MTAIEFHALRLSRVANRKVSESVHVNHAWVLYGHNHYMLVASDLLPDVDVRSITIQNDGISSALSIITTILCLQLNQPKSRKDALVI